MMFGIERDKIMEDLAIAAANKTDNRVRLSPKEKTAKQAAKYVNAEFRKSSGLQVKGAIPKDKRDVHEKYVKDNMKNIVIATYKKLYADEMSKKDLDEVVKQAVLIAL